MLNEQFNVSLAWTLEAGIYLTYSGKFAYSMLAWKHVMVAVTSSSPPLRYVYIFCRNGRKFLNLSYLIPEDGSIICCGKKILDTS